MDTLICTSCTFSKESIELETTTDMQCPECGGHLSKKEERKYQPEQHQVEFTGEAGEYFRIWIVNTFLTIITLGIYAAWAKVRNRQYFYAHTSIAGHHFDYLANPIAILKGNIIIGALFLIYMLSGHFAPDMAPLIVLIFYIILPFLIYKSLKFYAHNSAYRNIRFNFHGTLGQSYIIYIIKPLLIPITLGLYYPLWALNQKKYFFDNFAYGTTINNFEGKSDTFWKVYIIAFLQYTGIIFLGVLLIGFFVSTLTFGDTLSQDQSSLNKYLMLISMAFAYLVMLAGIALVQQYIYGRITNYCWSVSSLGKLSFISTLQVGKLAWIRITNIMAILFSIGLLIPWAKIRRTRYILDNLTVVSSQSLDDFTADVEPDVSALGDAATDFIDFEIGL